MNTETPDTNRTALWLIHINELDALRGIAILLVFLFHAVPIFGSNIHYANPLLNALSTFIFSFVFFGNTGVTLFFLLSSFLLSIPFLKSAQTNTPISAAKFYTRRILRIMPMYVVTIICGIIATGNVHAGLKAMFILWGLYGNELEPFSNVLWSLNAEMQFYFILPLIGLMYKSRSRAALLTISFIVYCVIYLLFVYHVIPINSIAVFLKLFHTLLGRGYIFVIGIMTAWVYVNYSDKIIEFINKKNWMKYGGGDFIFISIVLLLGVLLIKAKSIGYWNAETIYYYWHIGEAILWDLIIVTFLFIPFRLKPLFSNKFFIMMGRWSYSIYLTHHVVISYSGKFISKYLGLPVGTSSIASLPALLLIFIVCIGISGVTYNCIEKPFLNLKDKLH